MKTIELTPVEMTPEKMQMLEDKGLIIRLRPKHHELTPSEDETRVEAIYHSEPQYGAHMLITVTINRFTPAAFGTHPDNEDVLLIGDPNTKPMWFLIGLCKEEQFNQKIQAGTLTADDFIVFRSRFNDPEVSFFTMLQGTPHGECTIPGPEKPPSFYVTEPDNLPLNFTDFGSFEIRVKG